MSNNSVGVNSFVKRQTRESKFSHFEGSWGALCDLVAECFENQEPGYRPGVVLVNVPAERFRSGVVLLTPETELRAVFASRREGEAPFVTVEAIGGEKRQASHVQIVLYSRETLAENGENSTDKAWEIVSINARDTVDPEPLTPVAMMRNFLGLEGGTAAEYTAEEFANAILYWSKRAMAGE